MTKLRQENSIAQFAFCVGQFANSAALLSSQTQQLSSVRELRHCLARGWARARLGLGLGLGQGS